MTVPPGGAIIEHHGETWQELLSAYLDRQVTPAERDLVDGHLAACEDCREHLETLRATVRLVRDLPLVAAPRSFRIGPTAVHPRPSEPSSAAPENLPGVRIAEPAARRLRLLPSAFFYLRTATGLAAACLLIAVGAEAFGWGSGPAGAPTVPASIARQTQPAAAPERAAAAPAAAPQPASAGQTAPAAPVPAPAQPAAAPAEAPAASAPAAAPRAPAATVAPAAAAAAKPAATTAPVAARAPTADRPAEPVAAPYGAAQPAPEVTQSKATDGADRPPTPSADSAPVANEADQRRGTDATSDLTAASPPAEQPRSGGEFAAAPTATSVSPLRLAQLVLAVLVPGLGLATLAVYLKGRR